MSRGRHDELRQRSNVETLEFVSVWTMIAHAPAPSTASTIATAVETATPVIVRSSRLLNCISRISSAPCVVPSEVTKNVAESAAKSGPTSERP
jgi:hypothetical protein